MEQLVVLAQSGSGEPWNKGKLVGGFASRPKAEWDRLMESAKAHVRSMPLEFENSWPRL